MSAINTEIRAQTENFQDKFFDLPFISTWVPIVGCGQSPETVYFLPLFIFEESDSGRSTGSSPQSHSLSGTPLSPSRSGSWSSDYDINETLDDSIRSLIAAPFTSNESSNITGIKVNPEDDFPFNPSNEFSYFSENNPYPESMLQGHSHMNQIWSLPHITEGVLRDIAIKQRLRYWNYKGFNSLPTRKEEEKQIIQIYCGFCRRNKESQKIWTSHGIRDKAGRITCPILRAYICPTCQATGDNAHTLRYCPLYKGTNGQTGKKKTPLKFCRTPTGIIIPIYS